MTFCYGAICVINNYKDSIPVYYSYTTLHYFYYIEGGWICEYNIILLWFSSASKTDKFRGCFGMLGYCQNFGR